MHSSFLKVELINLTDCGMYTYRYVITMGLRSKYDVDGHYFIFALMLPFINESNMMSRHCCYVTYRICISYANI